MKKHALILALTTLFFAFTFDDDFLEKIVAQFEKYQINHPQEKAYLHFDKPYYSAGETIWFKAYLAEASELVPDTISVPLYVELIDNQVGKLISKKILKLEGGSAYSNFTLPDSLHSGYYRLRAYTNWMLNSDENLLFVKDFKVFKTGENDAPVKLNSQAIDFKFMPEGGNLVEGLESKVAYKAVDALGKGIDVSGIIMTEKGDTIMIFESEHLGMGTFLFKPQAGEKYIAKVGFKNVFEQKALLPEIQKEGFVMGIEAIVDKNNMRLFVGNNVSNMSGQISIVGQSRGKICYAAKTVSTKKMLLMKIPKNKFPEGVTQFTVFDDKGMPRCERLVYFKNNKPLNISFLPTKNAYQTREKVTVEIMAKDHEGKPVEGDFSVAVSDAGQILEAPYAENISTYLLLSSDVKGKIEQPAYYFDNTMPEANRHLDVLMMTQGWRRFKWSDIMKPEYEKPKFDLERGISLSGEISRQNGKMFEKPINLTFIFSLKDSTRLFGMGEAAKNGTFSLADLNFVDSAKVMIQAVAGSNRNTKIFINKNFSPKIQLVAIPYNAVSFEENELTEYLKRTKEALELEKILRFNKAQMLQEVVVKAKRKTEERDTRVLYSNASKSLKVDQTMIGYMNVLDLIRGRIAGVQVSGDAMNPTVTIRGASSFSGPSEPLFLLDGMRTDKSAILSLPVVDVEKVDILTGAESAIYGMGAGAGVISILTKRGNSDYDYSNEKAMGVELVNIAGYAPLKEFYAPNYDEKIPEHIRPDYRSTIYWLPKIKTNAEGKAVFSFFNTDAITDVTLHLEGLTAKGVPIAAKARYSVVK